MKKIFITATDTDAGKTYITTKLIQALEVQEINSICLKPVASGISKTSNINEDVDSILKAYKNKYSSEDVNFITFDEAVAPHLLAKKYNKPINISELEIFINKQSLYNNIILIEGAGGLLTPYSDTTTQLDLIKKLNCEILLVVNIKIGCINHALLTLNELQKNNIKLIGWIANCYIDIAYIDEQIETIESLSKIKCLLKISKNEDYLSFVKLSEKLISPDENVR